MSRRLIVLLAAVAALAALAVPAAQGAKKRKPPTKTVKVIDNSLLPAKLKVRRGTKIVWKWDVANSNPHDVKLVKAPKGVKKFRSPTGTAGITFARTLKAKGTYRLLCTFHANMRQTIVVR